MMARPAMYAYLLCVAALAGVAACASSEGASPVRVVDLIAGLDRAEQRPAAGVRVPGHMVGGVPHPALVLPVPSRVTWHLPLPHGAVLRTFVARSGATADAAPLPVRFRIGIADDRVYEGLTELTVTDVQHGWLELRADLSAYAGWKWSLFYRPDRVIWRVVLAADALAPGDAAVAWGSPEILADSADVREYFDRRRSME